MYRASTPKYFSENEIVSILSVLSKQKDIVLARVGLDLGARGGEVVELKWEDFDYSNRIVRIWDEKKDAERLCMMSDPTWGLLREYEGTIDRRKQRRVFPFSLRTANRRIKEWCKKAGIKRTVRFHMLRHTHVVQSRRAGRDWNWISQQTGDTVVTLIREYGMLSIEDRVDIANRYPILPNDIHTKGVTSSESRDTSTATASDTDGSKAE